MIHRRETPYLGWDWDWSHYRTARRSNARPGDFIVVRCQSFYRTAMDIVIATAWGIGVVGVGCAAWTLVTILFSLDRI